MTNFVMNQAQLDTLGTIANDLGRNAQALVDLVAGIRNNQVDDAAARAANDANAAIAAANVVRSRAAAGTATAEEVDDVEHQLAAADQNVAAQLASLREEVTAHGDHITNLRARMGTVETGQGELADQIGELNDIVRGTAATDDVPATPGLARRVTAVEEQVADLHRNGVATHDDIDWRMFALVLVATTLIFWLLGLIGLASWGWIGGIGIGAAVGAVLGVAASWFFGRRHHHHDNHH